MSPEEVRSRGWKELDIILVTGDAYVDHSSFGTAIIGRVLEDAGFRVGIIAQPRWDSPEDFRKLGKPRLFFSVSAGNTDSMVSNLTPGLKPREKDAYSPGGKTGLRPNRATIIYSNRIKEAFPEVPIVLGVLRLPYDALPITIIFQTRSDNPFWLMRLPILWSTAWENFRS